MQQKAIYRLTVQYDLKSRPYTFDFAFPPTRDDFAVLCKLLPWTHCWEKDLFPIIAKNDWPLVDSLHKASHVELDDEGQIVGRLSVDREWLYENQQHSIPYTTCDEEAKAILGVRADRRNDAYRLLMERQNYLREQFMLNDFDSAKRVQIMKQLLYENGYRKTRPKVKQ